MNLTKSNELNVINRFNVRFLSNNAFKCKNWGLNE